MKLKWKKETELERKAKISDHYSVIQRPNDEHRYTIQGEKKMAGGIVSENAIEIEASFHFNGSGPTAFGGAKTWPHVKLDVAFEEHQIEERDEFVTHLQMWLDNYFSK